MAIGKNELTSRLWTEWVDGLRSLQDLIEKERGELADWLCLGLCGNENFVQKAAVCARRTTYVGKLGDYKTRIGAYEATVVELLGEVKDMLSEKIEYKSTLSDIVIDGNTDLSNELWGAHIIGVYDKLGDCVGALIDTLNRVKDGSSVEGQIHTRLTSQST